MLKISRYISGGKTRCVQAAYRMIVHAATGVDVGKAQADQVTGYVAGRGRRSGIVCTMCFSFLEAPKRFLL